MNSFYDKYYEAMLHDLQSCQGKGLLHIVEIECCYQVAEKHWQQLRNWLAGHQFVTIEEEIFFFKIVKPPFIAEAEYYRLLSYGCNCCLNEIHPVDHQKFWIRQRDRLQKFKEKHAIFYDYYQSGKVNLDVVYYTRDSSCNENYAFDKTGSGYDILKSQLMARQQYCVYAEEQIKICMGKNNRRALKKGK